MAASSPTVLLTRTRTGGIIVVKLTAPGNDSQPLGVGDREPPSHHDRADVVVTTVEGESINYLESVRSRNDFKSTEMLMHALPFGESIPQCKSNGLCIHKTGGRVDNDSVEDMVSPVYIPSMGSLEVSLNRREALDHRHIEVMVISVRIFRQEPLVESIRMKRVTRGRTAGLEVLSFVDIDISSIRYLLAAIPSFVVSTIPGGHEVLRSSHASSQICTIFEREKPDIPFVGRW